MGSEKGSDRGGSRRADLSGLRGQIERIDEELLKLLSQRGELGALIGAMKDRTSAPIYDPTREFALLDRVGSLNRGPFSDASLRNIYREIFSATRALERELTISALGPAGAFAHMAALSLFGRSSSYRFAVSFDEVFQMVDSGEADMGVVPIENSFEGSIARVLDLLAGSGLKIYAEHTLDIHHNFMSKSTELGAIETIYTHYMSLAQSRGWIGRNLPRAKIVNTESTSDGARLAAKDPSAGAIASSVAAQIYGLKILAPNIEDQKGNKTRFIAISKDSAPSSPRSRPSKTSLVIRLNDAPGALYETLRPFSDNRINMTRIESRPARDGMWDYLFFIDIEGSASSRRIASALAQVRRRAKSVTLLGSYPASDRS